MKIHIDVFEIIDLLPDFLADCYFGLSAPELLGWAIVLLLSLLGHRA